MISLIFLMVKHVIAGVSGFNKVLSRTEDKLIVVFCQLRLADSRGCQLFLNQAFLALVTMALVLLIRLLGAFGSFSGSARLILGIVAQWVRVRGTHRDELSWTQV